MTRNVELFDRIADAIEAKPESYNQDSWTSTTPCGTSFCIAGYAAHLTGWAPPEEGANKWTKRGAAGFVDDIAGDALGLDEEEQSLFNFDWRPPEGETVPQALRRIGRGGDIHA